MENNFSERMLTAQEVYDFLKEDIYQILERSNPLMADAFDLIDEPTLIDVANLLYQAGVDEIVITEG
jgi:hypothetical protein